MCMCPFGMTARLTDPFLQHTIAEEHHLPTSIVTDCYSIVSLAAAIDRLLEFTTK